MSTKQEFDLTAIIGDVTFSKSDVYLWVKLVGTQYEFITDEERIDIAQNLTILLSSLVTREDKNVDCHIISSSKLFDAYDWIVKLNETDNLGSPRPYNKTYLHEMFEYVEGQQFRQKIVLLGVKLGRRLEFQPSKAFGIGPLDKFINLVAASPVSDYVSEKEYQFWNNKAEELRYSLRNSSTPTVPASANELAYVTRKAVFPAMYSPTIEELTFGEPEDQVYKWGEGEVVSLLDARIENHPKWLKITQEINGEIYSGYRASLAINKFPDIYSFPGTPPWMHYAARLPFPVDFSVRFSLVPSRKVRKEVGNKIKEAADQASNMTSAGGTTNIEIEEQLQLGQILDYSLKKDNTPWVYSYYRITVEGQTEEELKENVRQVIDHYRNLNMQVVWPSGDQLNLLKESLPNDHVRTNAYYQRQELPIIGAGIPAGEGEVGDQIVMMSGKSRGFLGPYIGYTIGQTQSPVFFSLHSAIDTNNSAGTSITGTSGSGKTSSGLTLATQMALGGCWTIYIDPKADALKLTNIPGLEASTIIDLRNSPAGVLDPFTIGETDADKQMLALETISYFVGGSGGLTNEQMVSLTRAIKTVASYPDASLDRIVDYLKEDRSSPSAMSLGARLNLIRDLPFARLCFAPGRRDAQFLRAENFLTIITILGLDLPDAETPKDQYTNANSLATAVMYLLTSLTKQLMFNTNKSHPKAIVIDEAWAVTSTQGGKRLVEDVTRMGRSHNTGLILISQNTGDFIDESIKNNISTRIAFRAKGQEVDNVLEYLELEVTDNNRDWVRNLPNGTCLIKDWSGRVAPVRIDIWNKVLSHAFETNPRARAELDAQ